MLVENDRTMEDPAKLAGDYLNARCAELAQFAMHRQYSRQSWKAAIASVKRPTPWRT